MPKRSIASNDSSEDIPLSFEISAEFVDQLAKKVGDYVITRVEDLMSKDAKHLAANRLDNMAICDNLTEQNTATSLSTTDYDKASLKRVKATVFNPYVDFIENYEQNNNCKISEDNLPLVLNEWDNLNDNCKLAYIKEAFLKKLLEDNKEQPTAAIKTNDSALNEEELEPSTLKKAGKCQYVGPKRKRKSPKKRKAKKRRKKTAVNRKAADHKLR